MHSSVPARNKWYVNRHSIKLGQDTMLGTQGRSSVPCSRSGLNYSSVDRAWFLIEGVPATRQATAVGYITRC
jgi:hypothetical protein